MSLCVVWDHLLSRCLFPAPIFSCRFWLLKRKSTDPFATLANFPHPWSCSGWRPCIHLPQACFFLYFFPWNPTQDQTVLHSCAVPHWQSGLYPALPKVASWSVSLSFNVHPQSFTQGNSLLTAILGPLYFCGWLLNYSEWTFPLT